MNKEEILEKSRQENKGKDISELQAIAQGSRIAILVGGLIGCVLMILEVYLEDSDRCRNILGLFFLGLLFSMMGTIRLVKYVKLRKKFELLLGIGYTLIAAVYIVFYIATLVK